MIRYRDTMSVAGILFLLVSLSSGVVLAEVSPPDEGSGLRIAIFRMSPDIGNFTANHATIEKAVNISHENGADWFITPEMAESGYEFTDYLSLDQVPEYPSPWFSRLENLSREENITLFIGFPERSGDEYHNSVAVIDRNGNISGIIRKTDVIPGGHEGWARPGEASPVVVDNLTIGYYICADAVNRNITERYLAGGADILLSSAAWYPDPSMGPESSWKNLSAASGIPLVIANTAGKKGKLDFTQADSGVYLHGREVYRIPGSDQVVAFVDWNYLTGGIVPAGVREVA